MGDISINLNKAKSICSSEIILDKDHKIDSFTSINTSGYFRQIDLNNKSLLTIGNSSDEVFDAVFYGAKKIVLTSDNPYTFYYYYLKLASMYSLTYREFEWFFYKYLNNSYHNNKMFSKKLFKKIKPILYLLNQESYYFFDELFDKYDAKVIRNSLFNDNDYHIKAMRNFNIYLRNDQTYNKTRKMMEKISFNYQDKSILEENITEKFDVINLSSLCVNISLDKLIHLISRLDKNNLSDNGMIILGYLWDNDMYTEDYPNVWKKIYQDPNSNKFLNKYLTDILYINGYRDFLWEENTKDDKVLIYNKR